MSELFFKKKVKNWFSSKPLFLLLFPPLFILNGWKEFIGFFSITQILLNLSVVTIGVLFIHGCSKLVLKPKIVASVFTLLLSLFIFTFGPIHDYWKSFLGNGFITSYAFLIPCSLFIFIFLILRMKKLSALSKKTIIFFNTTLALLFVFELITVAYIFLTRNQSNLLLDDRFAAVQTYTPNNSINDSLKPDIFFLVFDAMPSTSAMKEHWNVDNSELDRFLRRENFYVADNSKSNYNVTMLSVNSCMNMNYFSDEQIYKDGEIGMLRRGSRSIEKNPLLQILERENYKTESAQPVSIQQTDPQIESFFSRLLSYHYLYKTLPGRMYKDLGWRLMHYKITNRWLNHFETKNYQKKQRDLNTTIERVKKVCTNNNTPTFIYAHFLIPHSPFIFDSTGRLKSIPEIRAMKKKSPEMAFYQQVLFADRVISDLVSYIKKNNQNSIIIIIGDHGYRNASGTKGYMIFDNLTAIYYPDTDYSQLYDSISPVNIFRTTLSKHLGNGLGLLKDSSVFVPYNISR